MAIILADKESGRVSCDFSAENPKIPVIMAARFPICPFSADIDQYIRTSDRKPTPAIAHQRFDRPLYPSELDARTAVYAGYDGIYDTVPIAERNAAGRIRGKDQDWFVRHQHDVIEGVALGPILFPRTAGL